MGCPAPSIPSPQLVSPYSLHQPLFCRIFILSLSLSFSCCPCHHKQGQILVPEGSNPALLRSLLPPRHKPWFSTLEVFPGSLGWAELWLLLWRKWSSWGAMSLSWRGWFAVGLVYGKVSPSSCGILSSSTMDAHGGQGHCLFLTFPCEQGGLPRKGKGFRGAKELPPPWGTSACEPRPSRVPEHHQV